ncbi:MAG: hypothetical protein AAB393_18130 [Bacteroidota bacterium]
MRGCIAGRVAACYPWRVVWVVALPFLFSVLASGCREQIPTGPPATPVSLQFMLHLNDYYSFDNWKLDPDGFRIPSSRFRTSWRVLDTGAVAIGYPGVAIVIDSTFARDASGRDSLVGTSYRYFRTTSNGDVFEFGFVSKLLATRDTLVVDPRWDKLLSPSVMPNSLWIVESGDSTVGTVYARFLTARELVGTTVNGVASGVLAYHVEITGLNLTLSLWVSDSPSGFLRFRDDSNVPYNRIFQELTSLRTAR